MTANDEQGFPAEELPTQPEGQNDPRPACCADDSGPSCCADDSSSCADDPSSCAQSQDQSDAPPPEGAARGSTDESPSDASESAGPARADKSAADEPTSRLNIADVLAKLKTGAAPAEAAPDDIGSPEADVLAQAAEVLDGAAHTVQTEHLLAERTNDLQRVQAEYANYRKRVERDRALSRAQGAEGVIRELMPVFDGIAQAQEHEELTGGFKVVAGELARVMTGLGLVTFGTVGDEFDPTLHDALMQIPNPDVPAGHIAQVIQPGYKLGETVLRPARVAVASD
ncbi:MAG: nucleotide exchange factor GrpE [Propionibacteriaceae bacterium]|nr:nucleotide exchange factor GrpE [Propionibacteriaceae bacterium]